MPYPATDFPQGLSDRWLTATSDDLRALASVHHGACKNDDLDPAALSWRIVPDLPIGMVLPLMNDRSGWTDWLLDEIAIHETDQPERVQTWRDMMEQSLRDPIIITMTDDGILVWDGWHRIAICIAGGLHHIAAIVGSNGCDPR